MDFVYFTWIMVNLHQNSTECFGMIEKKVLWLGSSVELNHMAKFIWHLYILILGFENVERLNLVYRIQVCLNLVNIEFT